MEFIKVLYFAMAEFPWPVIKTASSFPFIGWFGLGSKTDIHLLKHFFSRESVPGGYYKDFQYFIIQIFS